VSARAGFWITGYYPGYQAEAMSPSKIDFTTVTHVIHFSVVPNTDGSLDSSANSLSPSACSNLVSAAHAANRPALICVGGANSESGFLGATMTGNLPVLVENLTNFMALYGYDGVDIDWEPFYAADVPQYTNFVNGLRSALNGFPAHKLITVAAEPYPPYLDSPTARVIMFASIQNELDQINVMTYDLSGPYGGWVSWFNSPLYDGGYVFPGTSELVPSINAAIANFVTNGIAPARLGVGAPFYGYAWTGGPGITQPRQAWPPSNAPTINALSYEQIITSYYHSNLYHWDAIAQAAYLSITNVPVSNDMFISYDDAKACQVKVSYARNEGLGGVMIWNLVQDYFPGEPAGRQSPLLQALQQAVDTPQITSAQLTNGVLTFSFTSLPLAVYQVLWTSNLTVAWSVLTNNFIGTGGVLRVIDTNVGQAERFYRVKTPP